MRLAFYYSSERLHDPVETLCNVKTNDILEAALFSQASVNRKSVNNVHCIILIGRVEARMIFLRLFSCHVQYYCSNAVTPSKVK